MPHEVGKAIEVPVFAIMKGGEVIDVCLSVEMYKLSVAGQPKSLIEMESIIPAVLTIPDVEER